MSIKKLGIFHPMQSSKDPQIFPWPISHWWQSSLLSVQSQSSLNAKVQQSQLIFLGHCPKCKIWPELQLTRPSRLALTTKSKSNQIKLANNWQILRKSVSQQPRRSRNNAQSATLKGRAGPGRGVWWNHNGKNKPCHICSFNGLTHQCQIKIQAEGDGRKKLIYVCTQVKMCHCHQIAVWEKNKTKQKRAKTWQLI